MTNEDFADGENSRLLSDFVSRLGTAALVAGAEPLRGDRRRFPDAEHGVDERRKGDGATAARTRAQPGRDSQHTAGDAGAAHPPRGVLPPESTAAEEFRRVPG